jgi:hypothetical protein
MQTVESAISKYRAATCMGFIIRRGVRDWSSICGSAGDWNSCAADVVCAPLTMTSERQIFERP